VCVLRSGVVMMLAVMSLPDRSSSLADASAEQV
jgi:hypothetical protein